MLRTKNSRKYLVITSAWTLAYFAIISFVWCVNRFNTAHKKHFHPTPHSLWWYYWHTTMWAGIVVPISFAIIAACFGFGWICEQIGKWISKAPDDEAKENVREAVNSV